MKLQGFISTALLAGLMVFGFTTKVNAIEQEEIVQVEESKSELAEWVDEDLEDLIVNVAASLSGTVIAMVAFLKSINALKSAFKKSGEENTGASKAIKECTNEIRDNNLATKVAIEENNKETVERITADNAATREEVEKLLKVFAIAFSNDSKLVKNGAAHEIMKVLGENNENTEA